MWCDHFGKGYKTAGSSSDKVFHNQSEIQLKSRASGEFFVLYYTVPTWYKISHHSHKSPPQLICCF